MDEFLEQLNAKLDALLTAQAKRPIEDGALYRLTEIAALIGCDYASVNRAANNGHLKTVGSPVGKQAWGRDVKAWINAGGCTGRNTGTVERERATA